MAWNILRPLRGSERLAEEATEMDSVDNENIPDANVRRTPGPFSDRNPGAFFSKNWLKISFGVVTVAVILIMANLINTNSKRITEVEKSIQVIKGLIKGDGKTMTSLSKNFHSHDPNTTLENLLLEIEGLQEEVENSKTSRNLLSDRLNRTTAGFAQMWRLFIKETNLTYCIDQLDDRLVSPIQDVFKLEVSAHIMNPILGAKLFTLNKNRSPLPGGDVVVTKDELKSSPLQHGISKILLVRLNGGDRISVKQYKEAGIVMKFKLCLSRSDTRIPGNQEAVIVNTAR